jgi:hypothetical protein
MFVKNQGNAQVMRMDKQSDPDMENATQVRAN